MKDFIEIFRSAVYVLRNNEKISAKKNEDSGLQNRSEKNKN